MMGMAMAMLFGLAPQGAEVPERPAVIRVLGRGSVRTPPDLATIGFAVRGEGSSSDEAVRALTDRREAIEAALRGKAEVRTDTLSVDAVRDPACRADGRSDEPRLSTGPCAIRGYVANLAMRARVTAVGEAGTLLALISRLGATDPVLRDYSLARPAAAGAAALTAAIRDAQGQAEAIAVAAGVALGPLRRVEDQRARRDDGDDIVVTGGRVMSIGELATRVPVVLLSPDPIETEATVIVEFGLGPPRR